ncbi:MAG: hypothetical protein AAGN15_15580 [Cyanobacteria bacterium J06581_3]
MCYRDQKREQKYLRDRTFHDSKDCWNKDNYMNAIALAVSPHTKMTLREILNAKETFDERVGELALQASTTIPPIC